jgi:hypothetical protein
MRSDQITITGYVIPVDWDKRGAVLGLSIVTDTFEKYIIADESSILELLGYMDRKVSCEAQILCNDSLGNKIIKLYQCKQFSEPTE